MWDQQGKQVCQGQQALDGAIEIIPFPAFKNTKKRHALPRIPARTTHQSRCNKQEAPQDKGTRHEDDERRAAGSIGNA